VSNLTSAIESLSKLCRKRSAFAKRFNGFSIDSNDAIALPSMPGADWGRV
jgi:hypothetical protein